MSRIPQINLGFITLERHDQLPSEKTEDGPC